MSNAKKLILGNGLAQLIQAGATFVLSRVYRPSDFGHLGQIQSMATVAVIFATLQLHLSLPLCKSEDEALESAGKIQTIVFSIFCCALPVASLFGKTYVYAAILMLFLGLSNLYSSYLVFSGAFGKLSIFYILRAIFVLLVQLGFVLISIPDGLLWGGIAGEAVTAMYLRITVLGGRQRLMKARDVLDFIIRFKAFSLFGTLQELISVSAFYSPMILFVRHFDKDIGGQYAMANRLVWAPVILLSGSLTQVLYHRYANELPSKETKLFKLLPNWKLVSFSLLVCGVSFYLKPIFLFILGKQWGLASNMLPLILLWGVVFFLSTPFRVLCRVMQLQKYQLSIDLGMLIAILALFELTSFSPISLMIGLVTIAATQNFLLIFFLYRALLQSNGPVMA